MYNFAKTTQFKEQSRQEIEMFEWIEANQLAVIVSAIATMSLAILAIFAFIFKLLRWTNKFVRWTGKVDTDRKTFRKAIAEIREDIKKLLHMASREITPGSPLHLTDLGESMSATLHGKDWARKIAEETGKEVAGLPPYDVQEFCRNYVHNVFKPDDEQEARIKQCAYEHGVSWEQVLNVLAVELRDILLSHNRDKP